ncbi:MAG: S-methyl-5-thioribose-1-phosphate isomerase [Candidatus Coatesbacteria bacterium]
MSRIVPLRFAGSSLRVLDQLALPARERWIACHTAGDVARAIRDMNVRGAPAIGIAAAYGLALAARRSRARTVSALLSDVGRAGSRLVQARPTAVNLAWAVNRIISEARGLGAPTPAALRAFVTAQAHAIEREDRAANLRMGRLGAALIRKRMDVLTHCNTGALATGGHGTALGVIRTAHALGRIRKVYVDETRPYLQGARLTAWELQRDHIPFVLITDSMAAHFMALGGIGAVLVGADRITRRGDVANKIGTYALAILARAHRIPFYVVAPTSTLDLALRRGRDIVIEERSADEVVRIAGTRIAPAGVRAAHPAFDVTPGTLVTAIVTEAGIARPPYAASLPRLLG